MLDTAAKTERKMTEEVVKHSVLVPSPVLRPFVKRFEVVQSFSERTHILLPDTSLVACFRMNGVAFLREQPALPMAILSGLQDKSRSLTHLAGSDVLLAVFTEAGAAGFLREPLDRLFNHTAPMDCLLPHAQLNELQEQLIGHREQRRKVDILERFLLARLHKESPDALAQVAAALIRKSHGSVRIEGLSRAMGLSLSALERRFRRSVGTSPRKFASIVRMRHVLRLHRSGGNLTDIAHLSGYFDQSHFIRDFKNFTGTAPESFFRQTPAFC
jgi:AraC-like DNA-binding protein